MGIYVQRNSKVWGPYSAAEVKSQLASGALSNYDPVRWKGQDAWVPLGQSSLAKNGFQELPGMETKPEKLPEGLSPSALGSFLCGFLSLIGGPLATLPGIALGHHGLYEIKKNPKRTGRKFAQAGLIMNYIMTPVTVLILISMFVFSDEVEHQSAQEAAITNLPPPLPAMPAVLQPSPEPPKPAPLPAATKPVPVMTNAVVLPVAPAPEENPNTGPVKE